jgi:hypothetical protein
MTQRVDALFWDGQHITREPCTKTLIGKCELWPSSENLATENSGQGGCQKCSSLNTKQPEENICAECLQHSEKDGDTFLSIIITHDETWVHNEDPLMKRTASGIVSSVIAKQEKIQAPDLCG